MRIARADSAVFTRVEKLSQDLALSHDAVLPVLYLLWEPIVEMEELVPDLLKQELVPLAWQEGIDAEGCFLDTCNGELC